MDRCNSVGRCTFDQSIYLLTKVISTTDSLVNIKNTYGDGQQGLKDFIRKLKQTEMC